MKLRLYRCSLRLRLSPAEVRQLRDAGDVAETTQLGGNSALVYRLRWRRSAKAISASLTSNEICVELPESVAMDWTTGESVGIEASQDLGENKTLRILIEKDWECLDPRGNEPGVKLYPNPRKNEQV